MCRRGRAGSLAGGRPLTGQFPAWYPPGPRGTATLHWGPGREAYLEVPLIRA